MGIDLESIKAEMFAYLEKEGFAVFLSEVEADGLGVIYWDTRRHPDFRNFLDTAKKCNVKMVVFYDSVFSQTAIDETLESLEDNAEFSREEKRNYELRLRELQKYEGFTCMIQLYFELNTHVFGFELRTQWYEEFEDIFADVAVVQPESVEETDDDDPMSGYFSRN